MNTITILLTVNLKDTATLEQTEDHREFAEIVARDAAERLTSCNRAVTNRVSDAVYVVTDPVSGSNTVTGNWKS